MPVVSTRLGRTFFVFNLQSSVFVAGAGAARASRPTFSFITHRRNIPPLRKRENQNQKNLNLHASAAHYTPWRRLTDSCTTSLRAMPRPCPPRRTVAHHAARANLPRSLHVGTNTTLHSPAHRKVAYARAGRWACGAAMCPCVRVRVRVRVDARHQHADHTHKK